MFTGLIEDRGKVTGLAGGRLTVATVLAEGSAEGDSMAVDGSCLTVAGKTRGSLFFQCSPETIARTVISGYHPGLEVNLERPLRLSDRLHGHLVTGHVDETASVLRVQREAGGMTAWVSCPSGSAGLLVRKGSVAVCGISLTVASLDSARFSVVLIPETLERTTAENWRPGTPVNLEYDILGKYVQKQVKALFSAVELRKYLEQ
ncbi:MAG: riboflavin synthase [Candidatus Fermentibacteraceae bacterium]|nr:riboflavin synthase [Candidatus Fermentibacteraceae bacterium]